MNGTDASKSHGILSTTNFVIVATSQSMAVAGLPFCAHLSRTVMQAHSRPAAASVTFEPLDVKGAIVAARSSPDAELSTRRRILAATFVVLARDGRRKLQLSDVAAEAKVSRPTLYRYFGSKEGLLEAFGLYEQDNFDSGIAAAMAGLSGAVRLDAALRFIVEFQSTYSLGSLATSNPSMS
jgi:AraC-like DNA-binding protein